MRMGGSCTESSPAEPLPAAPVLQSITVRSYAPVTTYLPFDGVVYAADAGTGRVLWSKNAADAAQNS